MMRHVGQRRGVNFDIVQTSLGFLLLIDNQPIDTFATYSLALARLDELLPPYNDDEERVVGDE